MARLRVLLLLIAVACLGACGAEDPSSGVDDLKVDTSTDAAWRQYLANVTFAKSYKARCKATKSSRPRVLITGFGRFLENASNATGQIVSTLVPAAKYPLTAPPPDGDVDDPAAQTSVAQATIHLPLTGDVDVCAMILPVYWDLAAVLAAKEIQAFRPGFVLMNGIAGPRQELWLELGSVNRAMGLTDGSGVLQPGEEGAPLLPKAPASDLLRPLLLSYDHVREAAESAIAARGSDVAHGERFDAFAHGVLFAGFPRESNTYLCNNLTYVVNYLLDHPKLGVKLLEPTKKHKGSPSGLTVSVTSDLRASPRVFVHWPSALAGEHLASAASVMGAIVDAQLQAIATGSEPPFRGDNAMAEVPAD